MRRTQRFVCLTLLGILCLLSPREAKSQGFAANQDIAAYSNRLGRTVVAPFAGAVQIDLTATPVTDDDLARLDDRSHVGRLILANTRIGDNGLRRLQKLTSLAHLDLTNCPITDDGLAALGDLTNLRSLNLNGTAITDAGLNAIKGLTGLQALGLRDTKVTDAGMAVVAKMRALTELDLGGTRVTDAGVSALTAIPGLCGLEFSASGVTEAGYQDLFRSKRRTSWIRMMTLKPLPAGKQPRHQPVSDAEAARIKRLIASLQQVEKPYYGFAATIDGSAFAPIAETEQIEAWQYSSGMEGPTHGLECPAPFRDLVQLGPKALPFLLDALDDETPTQIKLVPHNLHNCFEGIPFWGELFGNSIVKVPYEALGYSGSMGSMWFGRELWGNPLNARERKVPGDRLRDRPLPLMWSTYPVDPAAWVFPGVRLCDHLEQSISSYTVKVGDVCFVAIGEIVGRDYNAVRYQQTGCTVINSPTHDRALRTAVRALWSSDNPEAALCQSLLTDYATRGAYDGASLENWRIGSDFQCSAATRLLYYFPGESADLIAGRLRQFRMASTSRADDHPNVEEFIRQSLGNQVYADHFVKAVASSHLPAIEAALKEIVQRTPNRYLMLAAVPGIGNGPRQRQIIRDRLGAMLKAPEVVDSSPFAAAELLILLGKYGGEEAKSLFADYLSHPSIQQCDAVFDALGKTRGEWAIELLGPLLIDKRPTEMYAVQPGGHSPGISLRVCDLAADTICTHYKGFSFHMSGTDAARDRQIDAIRSAIKKPGDAAK